MELRHEDGTARFSELKAFTRSPAHYRYEMHHRRASSAVMRGGSLVDAMLVGNGTEFLVYEGERKGNAWKEYERANAGRAIYTAAEFGRACDVVDVIKADPIARDFLGLDDDERRVQVPLRWEMHGVAMSTRGVDVLTRGRLVDLKVTNSTAPGLLMWHARRMHWPTQLAAYDEACRQNGIDVSQGVFLLAVEAAPPHPVTALRMTDGALLAGRKTLATWLEQLRACELADAWPGYAQEPIDFDVPDDVELQFGDESAEDETEELKGNLG